MYYQENIKKFNPIFYNIINNAISNNKISHAYLLSGSKNQNLNLESLFLVEQIVNSFSEERDKINDPKKYADFQELGVDNKMIKKEELIIAIRKLQETPLTKNKIKILLINNIDKCNKHTLNALLKFLEEPTKKTYIIMNTKKLAAVIDTIKSRSQIILIREKTMEFKKQELLNIGFSKSESIFYSKLASSVEQAKEMKKGNSANDFNEIINIFSKAISKPEIIFSDLAELFKKSNFEKILQMINIFLNDIWKYSEQIETISSDQKLLDKYHNGTFDYIEAIKISGSFLKNIENNVNFNLATSNYLVQLWGLYE